MAVRKIELMHWYFGKLDGHRCRECSNLITGQYHDKTLRKCTVYGLSHSEASDWALRYAACGMFNKEWNGRPIIRLVKGNNSPDARKATDEPIEGQISFEQLRECGLSLGEKTDDVVKVVRCKDCCHCRDTINWDGRVFAGCHLRADICIFERQPNDFCSYGERKDND